MPFYLVQMTATTMPMPNEKHGKRINKENERKRERGKDREIEGERE